MPTPNWGPQAGVPMDEVTFDAYVTANPPGVERPGQFNVFWGGREAQKTPVGGSNASPAGQLDYWMEQFRRGPQAVQLPQFQTANQDQARAEQQRVIQALQAQAAGDMNSQAQQSLRQNYGLAQSQQSSLGSTMRGTSAGAAQRGIQAGQAGIQRGLAGDQQMLKSQEQQAAQVLLAQMLQQQHGQDVTQAQGMAQALNQGSALDRVMQQFYAQQGVGSAIEQAQIAGERLRSQYGFDLAGKDLTNQLLRQGAAAAAGGVATWAAQQKQPRYNDAGYDQQAIDDAFENG